ncbi:hypothetical protein CapIbe_021921 [Capra ibex]
MLQLFHRENFPRGLHRRNSLPTTCHSLDVSQDLLYSFCELISQSTSTGKAALTGSHRTNSPSSLCQSCGRNAVLDKQG